jgi:hypothetical protein
LNYPQGQVWMRSAARPRRRYPWVVGAVALAAISFGLGIALGQVLEENPEPSPASTTIVRTFTVPIEPPQTPGG